MPTHVAVLGSGSKGNCILVASSETKVLVDLGFSRLQTERRLAAVALAIADIDAAVLTHTHSDHVSSATVKLCAARRIPVYCHRGKAPLFESAIPSFPQLKDLGLLRLFSDDAFAIGALRFQPFPLPHDSDGVHVGMAISGGVASDRKLVIATDLGYMPHEHIDHILDCDLIVLESNHDPDMLWGSSRPAFLKERIAGQTGHLSNAQAADLLANIASRSRYGKPKRVVLAHLSQECNDADCAYRTVTQRLRRGGFPDVEVQLAHQDEPRSFCLTKRIREG